MRNIDWKKLIPHFIAVAIFLLVALVYCKPSVEGKVLPQHDVTQWKGMAQNSFQAKEKNGHFPLWTNGMFSGMPAYQITGYGYNPISIGFVGQIMNLNLPKPMSFFFLACLCFYFLSQVLKVNPYIGILGALSYAYATYHPVIISAGHDTKMQAIAYLPAFIGSLLLLYQKKYLWGTTLTAIFVSLLVGSNHLQITYYAFLIALIMSIGLGIQWMKEKDFTHIYKSAALALLAAFLGILVNAIVLVPTYEYSKATIRGGSQIGDGKGSVTKTGLSTDYSMSYSIYKTESLVVLFPRIYGGSNGNLELSEEKSKAIEALQQMPQQLGQQVQNYLQFYWGGLDSTSGPAYIGAIVCFLALVGFVVLDGKHKWWILAACLLAFSMSWGKYFESYNLIVLKLLPFYNKFRAPSMALVIPTLLFSMMAILSLQQLVMAEDKKAFFEKYKKGLWVVAAVFILALGLYFTGDFTSATDKSLLEQVSSIQDPQQKTALEQPVKSFLNGLQEDRKTLLMNDLLRSAFFIAIAAFVIFLSLKKKLPAMATLLIVGIFSFIDLITIDKNYLNSERYQDAEEYENNFKPSTADQQILKDTGYYRVLDVTQGIGPAFNGGAIPSYFHKSIGGYHPAKLSIYQDIIEKQLYNFPNCLPVINMLNTKYIITSGQQNGQGLLVQENPMALGAAWFVNGILAKKGPQEVMEALSNFNPKDTAIVEALDAKNSKANAQRDSSAKIQLVYNNNDIIEYQSNSSKDEFAVFSEVYYNKGWVATIDGKESPIIKTNYVLRGLQVPAGNHRIVFEFKPKSVSMSNQAGIGASAIIWVMLLLALYSSFKKPKKASV